MEGAYSAAAKRLNVSGVRYVYDDRGDGGHARRTADAELLEACSVEARVLLTNDNDFALLR